MANVLITGAAGGIGRALVGRFNAAGFDVIATDIVEQPLELQCRHYFKIDIERTVVDEKYAESRFSEIKECLADEELKALINNAAIQILGGVNSLTRQDWQKTLDINLVAPFIWAQALSLQLERSSGSVINISSIHARLTKKNFVAYATSKAALSGLTRAMAIDFDGRVRVNSIEPAAIETPMLMNGFNDKEAYEKLKQFHPIGRIGFPDEIAEAAIFLINDACGFINGSVLNCDGGIGGRLHDPE